MLILEKKGLRANNPGVYFRNLEEEEKNKCKVGRRNEIIKTVTEIN